MIMYFKMFYLFILLMYIYIYYYLFNSIADHMYNNLIFAIKLNGPFCIKIFQWLSNQYILNNIFKDRLLLLLDECPEHSFEYTKKIIEKEYGIHKFKSFCKTPIASGSIGQVYKAILNTNGKLCQVVVKVKHPDLNYQINLWFRVLDFLSRFFSLEIFDLQELKSHILLQMSYNTEFNNLISFRENFKDIDIVKIPKPYFNSENLIIMEYIQSKKFTSLKLEEKQKIEISKLIFYIITKMCVLDNFVHGDLHYGNWGVIMDNDNKNINNIVLYDAGIVSSGSDLYDNNDGFAIFLKCDHIEILNFVFNYLDKHKIKYSTQLYISIKKDWSENFKFEKSIPKLLWLFMNHKIILPSSLSTILLSCSLISNNMSYIYSNGKLSDIFKDLCIHPKKNGFHQVAKYFKNYYIKDQKFISFSEIKTADAKFNLDLCDISDISDIDSGSDSDSD